METKIYTEKKEKVIDFLIGFFGIPLGFGLFAGGVSAFVQFLFSPAHKSSFGFIAAIFGAIVWLVALVVPIILIVYFWRRRRFIALGLLYSIVVVPLILLGTCAVIFLGGGLMTGLSHR